MKPTLGQELPPKEFHITRDSLVRYAGASLDFNPIHYRDDVAATVGLPGVLAHGMLTMGVAIQVIAEFCGDSGVIFDYQVRFTKPVVVDPQKGAKLLVAGKISEINEEQSTYRVDLSVTCDSVAVLGKAQAWVRYQ